MKPVQIFISVAITEGSQERRDLVEQAALYLFDERRLATMISDHIADNTGGRADVRFNLETEVNTE